MKIKDLLKTTPARITLCYKWLAMEDDIYIVYERQPYARKTIVVYEGQSESSAIFHLMEK